jgi:hypothetical protein
METNVGYKATITKSPQTQRGTLLNEKLKLSLNFSFKSSNRILQVNW